MPNKYVKGDRFRNKLTNSIWEVNDFIESRNALQLICISSSIDREIGTDIEVDASTTLPTMWEYVHRISPNNEPDEYVTEVIKKINSIKQEKPRILTDEEMDRLRSLEGRCVELNPCRNWIYDVVILELVEGNKVKAWLNDINEKYLKFTLTCDTCHLTCTKLIADKDEYIRLITSPDEYWDEYIDSFMSKHFKVVEDDENDV